MIRDLRIGFVREPWVAELDFATLEKYPGEFIDDRLRQRRNDVIWRLRWGADWLYYQFSIGSTSFRRGDRERLYKNASEALRR